jgi:hypothetical protein
MRLTHPPEATTSVCAAWLGARRRAHLSASAVVPLLVAIVAGFGCAPYPTGVRMKPQAVDVDVGQLQRLGFTSGYFVCTVEGDVVQMIGRSIREDAMQVDALLPEDHLFDAVTNRAVSLDPGVVHRYRDGKYAVATKSGVEDRGLIVGYEGDFYTTRWGAVSPSPQAKVAPFDAVELKWAGYRWFSASLRPTEGTPETSLVLTGAHWVTLHDQDYPHWIRNLGRWFPNWDLEWTTPDRTFAGDNPPDLLFGGIDVHTKSRYWRLSGGAPISVERLPIRYDIPGSDSSIGAIWVDPGLNDSYSWQYLCLSVCQPSGSECVSAVVPITPTVHEVFQLERLKD